MRTVVILVLVTALAGGAGRAETAQTPGRTATAADDLASEVARLKGEIEALKSMLPDQSHVMKDIAYHVSNLWFAAQAQNWPLAGFYLNETRSHLKWAVSPAPGGS